MSLTPEELKARHKLYQARHIAKHPEYVEQHRAYVREWKRNNPDKLLLYAMHTVERYEALHGVPPSDSPFFTPNRATRYPDKESKTYWKAKRYILNHQEEGVQ